MVGRLASAPRRRYTPPPTRRAGGARADRRRRAAGDRGRAALDDVSLAVRARRDLRHRRRRRQRPGRAVRGAGRRARAATAARSPSPARPIRHFAPAAMSAAGIACVPPDRQRQGVVAAMSVRENAVLNIRAAAPPLARAAHPAGGRDAPPRRRWSSAYAIKVGIAGRPGAQPLRRQRAEADRRPRAGARAARAGRRQSDARARHRRRRRPCTPPSLPRCARGAAVLLISTDLDEIRRARASPRRALSRPTQRRARAPVPDRAHRGADGGRADAAPRGRDAGGCESAPSPLATVGRARRAASGAARSLRARDQRAGDRAGRRQSVDWRCARSPTAPSARAEGWSEVGVRTCPLLLAGLAVAIAFRAGIWNIGAEGQLVVGALAVAWLGTRVGALPGWLGAAAGARAPRRSAAPLWAAIAGAAQDGAQRRRGDQHDHAQLRRPRPGRLPGARAADGSGRHLSADRRGRRRGAPAAPVRRLPRARRPARRARRRRRCAYLLLFRTVLGYEMRAAGLNPRRRASGRPAHHRARCSARSRSAARSPAWPAASR